MTKKKFEEKCDNGKSAADKRKRVTCPRCKQKFLWLTGHGVCENCADLQAAREN